MDKVRRAQLPGVNTEEFLHLAGQRDRLGAALEYAAPRRDQRRIIIGPGGARFPEQPAPFLEADGGVGVDIKEYMAVIEGHLKVDGLREQHTVAEDVARHVADADNRDRLALHVDAHLAEMPLHRHPGTACGNAHLFVVVAHRPA